MISIRTAMTSLFWLSTKLQGVRITFGIPHGEEEGEFQCIFQHQIAPDHNIKNIKTFTACAVQLSS